MFAKHIGARLECRKWRTLRQRQAAPQFAVCDNAIAGKRLLRALHQSLEAGSNMVVGSCWRKKSAEGLNVPFSF